MKLSKRKIKQIKAWLEQKVIYRLGTCPFSNDSALCEDQLLAFKICKKAFPRLLHGKCPCDLYSYSYVIKKAKQMVKTGEV